MLLILTFIFPYLDIFILPSSAVNNEKYELGGLEFYTDSKQIYDAIKDVLPNAGSEMQFLKLNLGHKQPFLGNML